ncbi:MAG TPA: prenyltransferase/squalene oxidase repeat-containing protein [Pirellulales bacterium]|nr:prenyltransferase/squalene oxidase repeat-containing protein [Pirellulales bacterium]
MRRSLFIAVAVLLNGLAGSPAQCEAQLAQPEQRAMDFLARETAAWPAANKCFSCHNNGDAARALYAAVQRGYDVPADRLRETSDWLSKPADWRKAKIPEEFRDDRLSAIQFGAALVSAVEAGGVPERKTLIAAAESIAGEQDADGSWHVDASGQAGSPVTYGAALATWSARRTMLASGDERFRGAIAKADVWLRNHEAHNTPDVAAALLALADATDEAATMRREQCLEFLRRTQADGGGWGPYRNSPPEIFDTAVALLALAAQPRTAETDRLLDAGRKYLIAEQLADGSWVETTRPSGARSYAQRLSTTGWATLALVTTRREPRR